MIVSELKIFNFRRFKSENGAPGLQITFHKGLNALIGENDSGKTAVIDALKLVLLTQSNEYIGPSEEDFYISDNGEACSELRLIVRFQTLHKTKQRTLLNIFPSARPRIMLNIRWSFIIAHGKKDIRFIKNCV